MRPFFRDDLPMGKLRIKFAVPLMLLCEAGVGHTNGWTPPRQEIECETVAAKQHQVKNGRTIVSWIFKSGAIIE